MKKVFHAICIIAIMVITSCKHKDLCYHHAHMTTVRIEFDWSKAPDATPEGMCVFFYPMEGEDAPTRRFDFSGRTGGEIDIQRGRYCVQCYNNDTEAVLFWGMNEYLTHKGYTREGSVFEPLFGSAAIYAPRAEEAEDERVVISPDMMWGCSSIDVEVTEKGVNYLCIKHTDDDKHAANTVLTNERVITLSPVELVCTYTYEIRKVKNLKYVTQMCGTLSGMSPALLFGNEELDRECVTIPFNGSASDESTIEGRFLVFGYHEESEEPNKLLLYVWFADGSKYYYVFDATDQVHGAPDRHHVHICLEGLEFPKPTGIESGFDPSVDDWEEIEDDIMM